MRLRSPRTSFALSLAALIAFPALADTHAVATLAGRAPTAFARAQSPGRKQSGGWKSFRGAVGVYKVQMRLRRSGDALSGTYFYEHVRGGGLRLEGTIDGEGRFTLREFDSAGAQTGLFKGTWGRAEDEPEVSLTGEWSRPDGTRKAEFSLAEMSVAFSGGARILPRELKEADKRKNSEITVEYPQIEGMPAALAAGFNEAARSLAAKEAAEFRKGVADYLADYQGTLPTNLSSFLDLNYYVDYADDRLVSVGFTKDTFYAGAAHPNHETVVLNYDLKAGRALRLADLFRPGSPYLRVISDYCIKELKDDGGLPDYMIDEGAKASPENYRNWLVKREGLEITFDPYQVGPYVAGPQYVTIPYKALTGVINPAGPLAPFLK
jgi:Protein of unknown function (DUF3298)/Deacetylase PdaC